MESIQSIALLRKNSEKLPEDLKRHALSLSLSLSDLSEIPKSCKKRNN